MYQEVIVQQQKQWQYSRCYNSRCGEEFCSCTLASSRCISKDTPCKSCKNYMREIEQSKSPLDNVRAYTAFSSFYCTLLDQLGRDKTARKNVKKCRVINDWLQFLGEQPLNARQRRKEMSKDSHPRSRPRRISVGTQTRHTQVWPKPRKSLTWMQIVDQVQEEIRKELIGMSIS